MLGGPPCRAWPYLRVFFSRKLVFYHSLSILLSISLFWWIFKYKVNAYGDHSSNYWKGISLWIIWMNVKWENLSWLTTVRTWDVQFSKSNTNFTNSNFGFIWNIERKEIHRQCTNMLTSIYMMMWSIQLTYGKNYYKIFKSVRQLLSYKILEKWRTLFHVLLAEYTCLPHIFLKYMQWLANEVQ